MFSSTRSVSSSALPAEGAAGAAGAGVREARAGPERAEELVDGGRAPERIREAAQTGDQRGPREQALRRVPAGTAHQVRCFLSPALTRVMNAHRECI